MKRKAFTTLAALMICTAVLCTTMAWPRRQPRPLFRIRVTEHAVETNSPDEPQEEWDNFDTWLYVTNPSKDMETEWFTWMDDEEEKIGRRPVHIVEILSLTVTWTNPDGEIDEFDPLTPHNYAPYRWITRDFPDDVSMTAVYPGETAVACYIGWYNPQEPGVYKVKYVLSVAYEGETFDLTQEFRILAK